MKEKVFVQLLKIKEIDTPSSTFTENLMDYLTTEEEFLADQKLIAEYQLNEEPISLLSKDFTNNVLDALEKDPVLSFTPLISKKVFYIIFLLLLCPVALFSGKQSLDQIVYSQNITNLLEWLNQILTIPPILSLCLFSSLTLLALDFFLKESIFTNR